MTARAEDKMEIRGRGQRRESDRLARTAGWSDDREVKEHRSEPHGSVWKSDCGSCGLWFLSHERPKERVRIRIRTVFVLNVSEQDSHDEESDLVTVHT